MRHLIMLGFTALLALPAAAQTMTSQLKACQAIVDTQQRLACYDQISRGQPVPAPAPTPQYYAPPGPAAAPLNPPNYVGQFGAEDMGVLEPSHRLRYIISDIVELNMNRYGRFVVTLANGQTWKQLESDTDIAHPNKTTRRVKIERAFLGSYSLTFNDLRPAFKVSRVR